MSRWGSSTAAALRLHRAWAPTGRTPTFDNLKDIVASLRAANARFLNPGWIFHPRMINTLEKVKDTGRYLAGAGLLTFDRAQERAEQLYKQRAFKAVIADDAQQGTECG